MMIEFRTVNFIWEERCELFWKENDTTFPEIIKISYILTGLWVRQVHVLFKIHHTIHFTYVNYVSKEDYIQTRYQKTRDGDILKSCAKIFYWL